MNPAEDTASHTSYDKTSHGYASSESESRAPSNSAGKKRPSRAGTRSVNTLSAAQLERKRANDREAQRAIRQRTKDHIDGLERELNDLRVAQDASEKVIAVTQQRVRELEEENSYLRTRLGEPSQSTQHQPAEDPHPPDQKVIPHVNPPLAQASVGVSRRTDSISTPRSALSVTTSQSSNSRHGSWQHMATNFVPPSANAAQSLSGPSPVQMGLNLSTWRSQDSTHSVQSAPHHVSEHAQSQPHTPFSATQPGDQTQWTGPAQSYPYQEQQRPQHFEPPPQQQDQYGVPVVAGFVPAPTPHQPTYHVPPPPPPAPPAQPHVEYRTIGVAPPVQYHVQQQSYGQQAPYPPPTHVSNTPTHVTHPDYHSQPGAMQPPPISAPAYHTSQGEQQYAQQQVQPGMPFRVDPGQGYSITHYSSG